MYIEIPDLDKIIQEPTKEDLLSGLTSLDCGELSDSCVDICVNDYTYMQAIGCEKFGFIIEFQEGSLSEHYESVGKLSLDKTYEILSLYLESNPEWKKLFNFRLKDVSDRTKEVKSFTSRIWERVKNIFG